MGHSYDSTGVAKFFGFVQCQLVQGSIGKQTFHCLVFIIAGPDDRKSFREFTNVGVRAQNGTHIREQESAIAEERFEIYIRVKTMK